MNLVLKIPSKAVNNIAEAVNFNRMVQKADWLNTLQDNKACCSPNYLGKIIITIKKMKGRRGKNVKILITSQ